VAIVIRRGPRVLLVQRPSRGRWANMWEFPHGEAGSARPEAAPRRLAAELTGIAADSLEELLTLRHSVTHHRITLTCFTARYKSGEFHSSFYTRGLWLFPAQLSAYPVSAPQRRLARMLVQE
jgi:adenine-specific DNA glycosylase